MDKMIDVHCHILPEVDDGAVNQEMAWKMLKIAHEDGIGTIIATPHYHQSRGISDARVWNHQLGILREMSKKIYPDISIETGCEILYQQDSLEALRQGKAWTMAGSRYVLVEFLPDAAYSYLKGAVQNLLLEGHLPIVAHVERYMALNNIERVEELIDMGATIQANASSILGTGGWRTKRYLHKLLKQELVHLVGTDAHGIGRRNSQMGSCRDYINKKYGKSYGELLCRINGSKIINKENI